MAINPLSAISPTGLSGSSLGTSTTPFGKVLNATVVPQPPLDVSKPTPAHAIGIERVDSVAHTPATGHDVAKKVLDGVQRAQVRMDQVLKLAESGKSFRPAELLALQAHVYRASQELDLAGKVVEKATGGLKQVLQTQV